MKKKLALMLTILLSICMLCGCSEDPKKVDYNGKSYTDLSNEAVTNAYYVSYLSKYIDNPAEVSDKDREALAGYGYTDAQIDACTNWKDVESEYGKCTQFDDENFSLDSIDTTDIFSVDKAGNTVTTDLTLKFGKKDVVFEVVYDYYDMSVTGINMNPVQSMGEKMTSAGQNTVISMSIVFVVLILISIIIKGFVIFPKLEEKKKAKSANAVSDTKETPAVETAVEDTNLTNDTELVAVIAAAIAASEGTSTSGFVVRSINRR